MRIPFHLSIAVVAVVAACSEGAQMTAPAPQPPAPPPALQPSMRLVVLDSTKVPFAGTAADRAAGHYVFRILGTAPTIQPGDYVAGKQGGLFLGRVRSVSSSGDRLTLEMAPAAWSEVLRAFDIHIPFTPGAGSASTPYGEVRWGPWYLVDRQGQRINVTAPVPFRTGAGAHVDPLDFNPADFSLDDLDLCAIAGIGTCEISAHVLDAHFSLTGDIEAGGDFSPGSIIPPELPSLSVHAAVSQQLDAGLDVRLSGTGHVDVEVPLAVGFSRDFSCCDFISGSVSVGLILGVKANAEGTIQPHAEVSDAVTTGASFSTDNGLDFTFHAEGAFDAGAKVLELGDVGLKVSVGPKAEVSLDILGGGFSLGAGADGFIEGSENRQGPLDNQNWHVLVDVGTEAFLEGGVHVPLIDVDVSDSRTFTGPGIDLVELWGTGDLNVTTNTTGPDVFPGQIYGVSVVRANPTDPPPWPVVLASNLGVNASHLFSGGGLCHEFFPGAPVLLPFIPVGPQDCDLVGTGHAVNLTNIAWNCGAAEALPAAVQVMFRNPFDASARLTNRTIGVICRSALAVVRDRIDALVASGGIDFNIANALKVKLTSAETARDAGDAVTAANAMNAFSNQVRAQAGKHITAATAAELEAFEALLEQCYLTLVPTCSSVPGASLAAGSASH